MGDLKGGSKSCGCPAGGDVSLKNEKNGGYNCGYLATIPSITSFLRWFRVKPDITHKEFASMDQSLSLNDKVKRGSEDSGKYFQYMAEFVGFTQADADAIRESGLVVEKYIPEIVSRFYAQLLRYPPTRKFFLRKDGTLDQDYLQMRMHHLTNFWRRTAAGIYDDDYARYVDYVGRAHTERGADPNIYIPERYVIGQVGFMQHAISQAISRELHDIDPDWEVRSLARLEPVDDGDPGNALAR